MRGSGSDRSTTVPKCHDAGRCGGARRCSVNAQLTSATGRWPAGFIGEIPALSTIFLAVIVSGSLAAGLVDWPVLQSPMRSAVLLVFGVALTVAAAVVCAPSPVPASTQQHLVMALPAFGVLAGIVALAAAGGSRQLEWFLNGDHPRHVVYVVDTWAQGSLRYADEGYPRGWHSLLAAVWSSTGASTEVTGILGLLTVTSVASLLLSAMLALATAHTAFALGARAGLSSWASVWAGAAAASLALLNFAFANFQALGFQNSLLSAVALTACAREVLARPGSVWGVVVSCAGASVVAHSWQLLLPSMLAMVVFTLYTWWGSGALRRPMVAGAVLTSLLVVTAGGLAVARSLGLEHASEAGPDTPVPALLVLAGAACFVGLAVRLHRASVTTVAVVALLPALTSVVIAVVQGIPLGSYYPSKLLWHTAVAGLPAVSVVVGLALHRMARRRSLTTSAVRVVAGAATGLLILYGLLMPWGAVLGVWSSVDGAQVLKALRTPGAQTAQVVWLRSSPTTDAVTRSLLDAFRATETRDRAPQAAMSVPEECRLLKAAPAPVVLTTGTDKETRSRYQCVSGIEILRVGT